MSKFEKVEKEIERIIKNSPVREDSGHSKSTLEWVFKLKHDANEALRIAALAHDIDRAVGEGKKKVNELEDFTKYEKMH